MVGEHDDRDASGGGDRQHAFKVRPNPAFRVSGEWWTGVMLQQACEAVMGRDRL